MQIARGLIRQQKFRSGDDGAGYADKLLLPTGKLPRVQIFFADDLKTVERVGHQGSSLALTITSIGERNIEVLVNSEIVEQMILLKDKSNLFVSQSCALFRLQMMHRRFVEKVFTRPAVIVHAENVQEGRLARARRAHYGDKIAFCDIEIDVAQDIKGLTLPQRVGTFDVA